MSFQIMQGNIKTLDWNRTAEHAARLSPQALDYAINDAMACVIGDVDAGFYLDQLSIYRQEQQRRQYPRKAARQ